MIQTNELKRLLEEQGIESTEEQLLSLIHIYSALKTKRKQEVCRKPVECR